MAEQYHEAPPLPRVPTVIGSSPVPPPQQQQTTDTSTSLPTNLPAPPKFPSLSDVDLGNAQQAAESVGLPQQQQPTIATDSETTLATEVPEIIDGAHLENPSMHDDISKVIQRDSVTPGFGIQRALQAGAGHWTDEDQKDLDKLLKEGKRVYVPPDVEAYDLPVTRDTHFVPVPPTAGEASPSDSHGSYTLPQRIAMWNQVIVKQGEDSNTATEARFVPVGTTGEGITTSTDEPQQQQQMTDSGDRAVDHGDVGRDVTESSSSPAEMPGNSSKNSCTPSSKINGSTVAPIAATFLTVEVISKRDRNQVQSDLSDKPSLLDKTKAETMATVDTENSITDEPLLVDSSANISVTEDYGLKGGHASRVYDAAFVDADTLVTCGADGKVIIWHMPSRSVDKEFVPYQGEPVTMIYPMTDDEHSESYTLMTLSESRLLRVWSVEDTHAVVLHSAQITPSDKELFMSVPIISSQIREQAAAAIAAAKAQMGTDTSNIKTQPQEESIPAPIDDPNIKTTTEQQASAATAPEQSTPASTMETDKKDKRFSLTKVLSFGRRGNKEPVAS